MPTIQLTEPTFARLQKHATPLIDTPDTIIWRLLDSYEACEEPEAMEPHRPISAESRLCHPLNPPNLTHTKLLAGRLMDDSLGAKTNWNSLLFDLVRIAGERAASPEEFRNMLPIRWVDGEKETEGFHYMEGPGISVQGRDANGAWKAICHLARELEVGLQVTFLWREREGAQYPGETGYFNVPASMKRAEEMSRQIRSL